MALEIPRDESPIMANHYVYSPLPDDQPSIRLISLHPSRHTEDPIRCDILQASISSNPSYEALSYTWDPDRPLSALEPKSYTITLANHAFTITPNLYFALRQIRDREQPRTLWIDAMCINQCDNAEKCQQVRIMSAIYSLAKRVLVWLGEEESDDASAFALIERFQLAFPVQEACNMETIFDFKVRSIQSDNLSWKALGALLRRRWFSRVWVVQEVVMAREALMICGSRTLPWMMLEETVSTILRLGMSNEFVDISPGGRGSVMGMFILKVQRLKVLLASGVKLGLFDAIGMMRTLDATDPRDKIFSVLAFVRDADLIMPDYSISIDELLRKVNVASMAPSADFRILSFFDAQSVEHPCKLTPWGPNLLDIELDREAFLTWGSRIEGSVAGSCPPHVTVSEDGALLTLRAIFFDKVDRRSCKFHRFPSSAPLDIWESTKAKLDHFGRYLASCQKVAAGARSSTHPGHDSAEAFWRTLICNLDMECRKATASIRNAYLAFVQFLFLMDSFHRTSNSPNVLHLDIVSKKGREGSPFERLFTRAAAGRVFCNTRNGYMGMVPAKAKKGDVVCAFLGAHTMFVIRPKPDGIYQLIGESYIHGTTNEEILEWPDFEDRLADITLG